MKKQILKGVTMLGLVIALALVTAVTSAQAQTVERLKADIPFDYVIGDQKLPAGVYTIQRVGAWTDRGLLLRKQDGSEKVLLMTDVVRSLNSKDETVLIFHRYGERYFLSQIWASGSTEGRALHKSSEERAIQREMKNARPRELAKNLKPETVIIVLQAQ